MFTECLRFIAIYSVIGALRDLSVPRHVPRSLHNGVLNQSLKGSPRTAIIGAMIDWTSYGAGVFTGLIANNLTTLWTRFRAYKNAEKLVGKWTLYRRQGRIVEQPIDGALTEILRRPWQSRFSVDSHVLPVHAKDPDGREHDDYLAIDPACRWRAIRTILYRDTDEIAQQRIEISPSGNTLYVFPDPPDQGYEQHALRRST